MPELNPYESPQLAPGRSKAPLILACVAACLLLVFFVFLARWPLKSWVFDYDYAAHRSLTQQIAADPQRFGGRELTEVTSELGLEGIPWDDAVVQTGGSCRMYHFPGFVLTVHLEYARERITEKMFRDLSEEQLNARDDLLRIHPRFRPFANIDGISTREQRMQQYHTRLQADFDRINAEMDSHRQRPHKQKT
jgi:hypothetical protein